MEENRAQILWGISVIGNEETEDCDFNGFPNEDDKIREGLRDIVAGTSSMISTVKKFMAKIRQLEDKIRKLENISREHKKHQRVFAD